MAMMLVTNLTDLGIELEKHLENITQRYSQQWGYSSDVDRFRLVVLSQPQSRWQIYKLSRVPFYWTAGGRAPTWVVGCPGSTSRGEMNIPKKVRQGGILSTSCTCNSKLMIYDYACEDDAFEDLNTQHGDTTNHSSTIDHSPTID